MALIPATITVNFTSNYAGQHRICWRTGGVGAYDCTTLVACTGGGAPCSGLIPIMVDNDTCENVDFDGYVQAACEVEGSLNGRISFAVTFVPNPTCDKWDVTCNAVGIPEYNVLYPGSGYSVGATPALTIIGGGGSAAAAHGVIGDGGIKTFTITLGGSAYLGGGSGTVNDVPAVTLTGVGSGALFDVTITAGVVTAIVLTSADLAPGVDYAIGNTFEFDAADLGGTGSGVVITVDTLNTGEVQYIVVDTIGSGYTSLPTVTVDSSASDTATAEAVLGECPSFDFGNDCDSNAIGFVDPQPLAFVYKKCSPTAPTPPAEWVVAANGCCYDCVTAIFTAIGVDSEISYTDCTTGELITIIVELATPLEVCVVNNSWYWDDTLNVDVATSPGCP